MPGRGGTVTRAAPGLGFAPRAAPRAWSPARSGCSWSAPASATRHLPQIDQVDSRHLSADGA